MLYFSVPKLWHTCAHYHSHHSILIAKNIVIFCKKRYFSILLSDMNVNCMPIGCFISSYFTIKTFLFSYLVVAIHMHNTILTWAQNGGMKGSKMVTFCWKIYFWSLILKLKVTYMSIATFIISFSMVNPSFFSS